ncbi:coadhesin-like [Babylonia areolata]|uniref:coadhesin-like n=1 Tax=Babylonia areolata TaxID=304850 RepID=UPI003FD57EA4
MKYQVILFLCLLGLSVTWADDDDDDDHYGGRNRKSHWLCNLKCKNGGWCEWTFSGRECQCPWNYFGHRCEHKLVDFDGPWSPWSACSKSCGFGTRTRNRTCDSFFGCFGSSEENTTCNTHPCPSAKWGSWGEWGTCSQTCGGGNKTRTRQCPKETVSGPCEGEASQTIECNTQGCPVWGPWGDWGPCNQTCGNGTKVRTRPCYNAPPALGVRACHGPESDRGPCNTQQCPVDGAWGAWGAWGTCTKTCGTGARVRSRACDTPSPSNGGAECAGCGSETDTCNTQDCPVPVNGNWGSWGAWGACTKTCGNGTQTRTRTCDSPSASNGGADCQGPESEEAACNTEDCPPPEKTCRFMPDCNIDIEFCIDSRCICRPNFFLNTTSNECLKDCPVDKLQTTYLKFKGGEMPNNLKGSPLTNATLESCQAACNQDDECVAVTMYEAEKKCTLHVHNAKSFMWQFDRPTTDFYNRHCV